MTTHPDVPVPPGVKIVAGDDLEKLPVAEVEKRFRSSPDGLRAAEAKARLARCGATAIPGTKSGG